MKETLPISTMNMRELRILASHLARRAYKSETTVSYQQLADYLRTSFGEKFDSSDNNQFLNCLNMSVGNLVVGGYLKLAPTETSSQFYVTKLGYNIGRTAAKQARHALDDDRLYKVLPRRSAVSA